MDKANSNGPATGCRPDCTADAYDADGQHYKSVMGEVKLEKASKKTIKKDLYIVAVFTKDELCRKGLKGVLGFQAIGKAFRLSIPKKTN